MRRRHLPQARSQPGDPDVAPLAVAGVQAPSVPALQAGADRDDRPDADAGGAGGSSWKGDPASAWGGGDAPRDDSSEGGGFRGPVRPEGAGATRSRPIPPKFYRIGELAAYCGVSRQTIHNYTTMGIVREARWTRGGHRLYAESVFDRLDEIAELKRSGRSMEFIREHFRRVDATNPAGR